MSKDHRWTCTLCGAKWFGAAFDGGATILWYGKIRDDDELCPTCGKSLWEWREKRRTETT